MLTATQEEQQGRTAYLWARACAAFVLVARDSLKRLWQSLWRRYGPALEGVSNQIVTFDFESLQKQTAQVTRDTAKNIIELGADVDRKFNLGGKLKGAAKTTLDVITPGHDDEWRDDGTPVRPAVSAGEGLKRVRRRVGSAATRARDWMLGRDEVVEKEPPSSMQQLSTALFLMLPAIFVVAVDHRDEVMASWESLSKVAAAAVAAAAIEASNSPMAALSFMAEPGTRHAPAACERHGRKARRVSVDARHREASRVDGVGGVAGDRHVTAQTTDSTLPPRCSSCSFATAR